MKPDICIYHAPCQDGFTAAWAIWKRWPDVEFVPGVYGAAPPDVTGKHVLLVDFSYKLPVLQQMGKVAKSITIVDHHKSAQADLAAFIRPLTSLEAFADECEWQGVLPIQARFDMDKSGASLAWEYAHGAEPRPLMIGNVEDRDLWRFYLEQTRGICAVLFSHEYSFEVWDRLSDRVQQTHSRVAMVAEGEAIERKHHKDVAELLRMTAREMTIGGVIVPVANLPYTLSSDAANILADGRPFGACYYDNAEGNRVFSLRSKEGGADVSEIAVSYGGGGHARAAGFTAPKGWEGE